MENFIFDFKSLRQEDNDMVGKKCANLGELTHGGFNVPPGFALCLSAYEKFMNETGLVKKIDDYLCTMKLDPHTIEGIAEFDKASLVIRKMVEDTPMPKEVAEKVSKYYKELCESEGIDNIPVATRSAGPSSHPGQYETYLNISGEKDVIFNIKKVWSSTFNTRSIIARARLGLPLSFDPIGVAILKMVKAKAAGIMFTVNPANGDPTKVYIEGNFGLGESVVSGEVSPDSFIIDKKTSKIVKRNITPKTIWYVPDKETGVVSAQKVPEDLRNIQCICDEEIFEIARVGCDIEKYFGAAQDIEWSIDSDKKFPENIYFVQTRNVTKAFKEEKAEDKIVDMLMRGF